MQYANERRMHTGVPEKPFQQASAEPKRVVQKAAQIGAESTEMEGKQKQKNPDLPGYSATLPIVPIGATGFEDEAPMQKGLKKAPSSESVAQIPAHLATDDNFSAVLRAWTDLPESVRAGIAAMVKAAVR